MTAGAFLRRNCERPPNTEISSEDRAVLAIADFVCFISLLGGAQLTLAHGHQSGHVLADGLYA